MHDVLKNKDAASGERLKVGIIGAGYWGPNLIRNFTACQSTQTVAVCDANPARLEAIGRQFTHVKLVASVEELLNMKLDAVAIATPVSTHHPLAKKCLEAGLHVMVEKPLAATSAEAADLVAIAKKHNRVLMVDHTYLFNPAVQKMKQIIASGDLGELFYIDSVRINLGLFQRDVNVVWDLAPHDLSIIHYLVGRSPISIGAWGSAHANHDIEDAAYVNIDYGRALMASIHVNWLSPVKVRQMIFGGARKSVIFNELNSTEPVKIYDRGIELSEAMAPSEEAKRRMLVGYRTGDVMSPHIEPREALQGVVKHFAHCITTGETPITDGELGLQIVRMLEASNLSMRQGGRIMLSGDETIPTNGQHDQSHEQANARAFRPGQFPAHLTGRAAG